MRFPETPLVRSVLHPTDFSEASEAAFEHALAIALVRGTVFNILHVGRADQQGAWSSFPPVRRTLERWGLLEPGSPRSAVLKELDVSVGKAVVDSRDPVRGILRFLSKNPTDLIVLSTRGQEGLPHWLKRSVAEPLARRSHTMTLFVPKGARGFVAPADGSITLERVLIPVDAEPAPDAALEFAMRTAKVLGAPPLQVTLLHAGSTPPALRLPADPAWSWNKRQASGPVVDAIVDAAEAAQADLIVMVTAGHHGILDAVRGSTTEQVLRRARCPVLAIPTAWVEKVAG